MSVTHRCLQCGATFETLAAQMDHIEDCDEYVCLDCGEAFDTYAEELEHHHPKDHRGEPEPERPDRFVDHSEPKEDTLAHPTDAPEAWQ